MSDYYRFHFAPGVPFEEVEGSLLLALFAVESLHGEALTRLDADYTLDREQRQCTIGTSTAVGQSLVRVFAGFVQREFGTSTFRVERFSASDESRKEVTA